MYCLIKRAARLGQDAHELGLAERLELDADRKAALQFGDQVRRLRHVKRAGGDEQDVIGPHHAVLGVDGRAFDDRQDVALHAFAADFRPVAAFAAGDLVDLVDEDDAGLLDALDRGVGDRVHVDQLLLFFGQQPLARFGHGDAAALRAALEQSRHHVAQVDADFFHRRSGDQLDRRERFLLDVDFDHAIVELAVAQLLAHPLARAAHLVADAARIFVRRRRPRRQQQIEQPLLGIELRLGAHFFDALFAHHVDGELDQIADHRLDVAADVADFGELRRFDLDERRMRQLREPPRDLGLADAGRPDHQDVLRRDVLGQLRRQLLAPQPVAQRNRDRALGLRLPDHVLVELGDDLARRQRIDPGRGALGKGNGITVLRS